MKTTFTAVLIALLGWTAVHAAAASEEAPRAAAGRDRNAALYQSDTAVIVVTGMRLDENPDNYTKDLSVAEEATVKVTARDGTTREKRTEVFLRGKKGGSPQEYFTADFSVDLGATYSIAMTFKEDTVVQIKDYTIPRDWKTHFHFHSTTGTKSPASILRFVEDPKTKLRCCVYALYPLESYRKLGGRQTP